MLTPILRFRAETTPSDLEFSWIAGGVRPTLPPVRISQSHIPIPTLPKTFRKIFILRALEAPRLLRPQPCPGTLGNYEKRHKEYKIMFGDLTVFSRPVVPAGPDDSPTFPLYLLPTFNFPFRRKRARSHQIATEAAPSPDENTVPSLSTSPESPTQASSPVSLRSFLAEQPDTDFKPVTRTAGGSRLNRLQPGTLRCGTCSADIAFVAQIVSKGFTGRYGRAFLVAPPSTQATPSCPSSPVNDNISAGSTEADLINIRVGRPENRQLVTGQHVVADIWCAICATKLGWKYVDAREPAQKYKVGKFILETQRVVAHHTWEDVDTSAPGGDLAWPHSPVRTKTGAVRTSIDTGTDSSGAPSRVSAESDLREEDDVIVFDSEDEDECEDIFAGVWDPDVVAKRRRGKIANLRRNDAA